MESTRKREVEVKKDTAERLELFRSQREEASRLAREAEAQDDEGGDQDVSWKTAGRKRKKGKEREVVKGVKLRRTSSAAVESLDERSKASLPGVPAQKSGTSEGDGISKSAAQSTGSGPQSAMLSMSPARPRLGPQTAPQPLASGLVDYGSDSD